jgi:hypothetical protein
VALERRIDQCSPKRADHCRRFMVSAAIKDLVKHFDAVSERGEERWVPFAQNPRYAQSKRLRSHLDLNH